MVINDEQGKEGMPFYLTQSFAYLSLLFSFQWVQRYMLIQSTKKVEWDLVKMFLN